MFEVTKQAFWCTKSMQGTVEMSVCLDYSELPNVPSKVVKAVLFCKRHRKMQDSWYFEG